MEVSQETVKVRSKAVIDQSRCDGALSCPARRICSKAAIVPEKELAVNFPGMTEINVYKVVDELCTGCGQCVPACPRQAINIVSSD